MQNLLEEESKSDIDEFMYAEVGKLLFSFLFSFIHTVFLFIQSFIFVFNTCLVFFFCFCVQLGETDLLCELLGENFLLKADIMADLGPVRSLANLYESLAWLSGGFCQNIKLPLIFSSLFYFPK